MIIGISNLIGNANQRKSKYGNLPSSESFIFTANTSLTSSGSSTSTQFRLPLVSNGTINFVVDWGDGTSNTITTFNQAEITHTYPSAGTYIISLTGTIRGFRFANSGDRLKILNIRNWGTFNMTDNASFHGCGNLNATAKDTPIISTTNLSLCFAGCSRFNGYVGNWDTSNVTTMSQMFNGCLAFNNVGIGNWNTSKVTDMLAMFQFARNFNQDISTKEVTVNGVTYIAWDTLNVTTMSGMLNAGTGNEGKFNQNIGNWNISKVTNLGLVFGRQPNFNQDISTKVVTVGDSTYTAWDTLNVTNMAAAIANVTSNGKFNQNIGNWNTSKVTTMSQMLQVQPDFNQDISTKVVTVNGVTYTAWDTSNVTAMNGILFGSTPEAIGKFIQNIGNWNTSKVTNMSSMFNRQPLFNQDISTKTVTVGANTYTAWDTLNVTNMSGLFFIPNGFTTGSFNQNINNWNTIKVTNMSDMFSNQKEFNQLIDNWNVSLVTLFDGTTPPTIGFMVGKTFEDYSSANYDALLIGWSSRPVQPNLSINFGTIKYSSAGVAARAILTSAPNNWTITDGGEI
jgi:surface protein